MIATRLLNVVAVCLLVQSLFLCGQSQAQMQAQRNAVDVWIMRNRSEQQLKEQFELQASRKIEHLRNVCDLRPEQVEKLRLAAAGDVNRLFNAIASMRHETGSLDITKQEDSLKASRVLQSLMARTQSNIFAEDSLFATALDRTLDQDQRDAHQRDVANKLEQRHHALALSAVASLDERLGLVKDQRDKLVELMDEQSCPNLPAMYECYVGYIKLSVTPDADLSKVLDAEQIALVRQTCARYRNMLPGLR